MADNNAVWARPGSEAAVAAEQSEKIQNENITEPASSESAVKEEVEVSAPIDSVELNHRDRQTDFFNSLSGVDSAEHEDNEVYTPIGLLEVPFNDTPHNLGYRIPKMRFAMSRQTKRKVIAFSSIFGGIATLIAAVIVLNSIFGFIPTVKQIPILYTKGGAVYMTTSTGRFPEQLLFDGNANQIANNSNLVSFSPNNEDVLIASDYSSSSGTYSLRLHNDMAVSEQGTMIDSNIVGEIEYAFGGDAILYLKNKGTNDLYFRNLKNDGSIRIERKIERFGMLSDKVAVIQAVGGNISTVTLEKDGTFNVNEVVKLTDGMYLDAETTNAFYFIKDERNTESSERIKVLYRYSDGKISKVATGAERLVAYSCADNWAYYTNSESVHHKFLDYIEDDCLESDNALLSNFDGMNFTDELLYAFQRNNMRKNFEKAGIEAEYMSIGYYADGKASQIESGCTQIYAVDLDGQYSTYDQKSNKSIYNQYKFGLSGGKKAGIMYESSINTDYRILMSEIPEYILSNNNGVKYEYVQSIITSEAFDKTNCVIAGGRRVAVDAIKFTDDAVGFDPMYSNFYYISVPNSNSEQDDIPDTLDEPVNENARADSEKNEAKYGDLMSVKLVGSDVSAQPIAVDVKNFEVLTGNTVMYINSEDTVYVGSVAIANRVKSIRINRSRNAAAILCEAVDSGARLTVYKDGATKAIADNVHSVNFNDDSVLSFIKDYDKAKAQGDLYVCRNFGTPSRIDTNVSNIVNYSY